MAAPQDRLGQQMGEYRLLRLLGKGAFGAVYLTEHVHDDSQAAVKLLQIQLNRPEDFKAFLNEARTIRLRHPHIVPLLDFGLSRDSQPFLVMEYAAGGTVRDSHAKGSCLPLPTIVSYVQQVASALQYAHERRVIHRDVKPENMLVRADGSLLLSDFGIATVAHSSHSINLQQGIGGTLPYMAPEQIQGRPRPASDQYALAVVVYEWIAGQRPFQGTAVEIAMQHAMTAPPSLLELVPTLSRDVEQVVLKALAKEPKERFASIEQFAQALQAAILSPPAPALQNIPIAPALPSVALTPSTPIPVSQNPAVQPTLAGMPVDTVSPSEQSQQRSRTLDTPLPQSGRAQLASDSVQTDPAATLRAPGMPTRPFLIAPATSLTSKGGQSIEISISRRFVLLGLAVLLIVALASGITWFAIYHVSGTYTANSIATVTAVPTAKSQLRAVVTDASGQIKTYPILWVYAVNSSGVASAVNEQSFFNNGILGMSPPWFHSNFEAWLATIKNGGYVLVVNPSQPVQPTIQEVEAITGNTAEAYPDANPTYTLIGGEQVKQQFQFDLLPQ